MRNVFFFLADLYKDLYDIMNDMLQQHSQSKNSYLFYVKKYLSLRTMKTNYVYGIISGFVVLLQ